MNEKLKKSFPHIFGLVYILFCIIAMGFCYVILTSDYGDGIGFNGFEIVSAGSLGVWSGLMITFQILSVLVLMMLGCIFVLRILNMYEIVKFEVTYKKLTIEKLVKGLMLAVAILSTLLWFCCLGTILANKDYGLVFGAGSFLFIAVAWIGYILFMVFFKSGIDHVEEYVSAEKVQPKEHKEAKEQNIDMVDEDPIDPVEQKSELEE